MNKFFYFLPLLFLIIFTSLPAQESKLVVTHYSIKTEILPFEHKLVSEATVTLKNFSSNTFNQIEFYLSSNKIYWIKDGSSKQLPFDFESNDSNRISINTTILPNDSTNLKFYYEGIFLSQVSNRIDLKNSWLLTESGWFPRPIENLNYQNRFTYDLSITVPDTLMALSSGELINTEKLQGKNIFYWKSDLPTPIISISIANYVKKEYKFGDLKINTYLYKEHADKGDALAQLTKSILDFFVSRFGKYPLSDYKIVETDRRGGYGAPGMILLNSFSISQISDSLESNALMKILPHEIAHQWWGTKVIFTDYPFMNESLASYSTFDYWDASGLFKQPQTVRLFRIPKLGIDVKSEYDFNEAIYSQNIKLYEYTSISEAAMGQKNYSWLVHGKGYFFIRSLNFFLKGKNIDDVLKIFLERNELKSVKLKDFQNTVEEISGKKLENYFNDFLFTTKRLDFSVTDIQNINFNNKIQSKIEVKNLGDIELPVKVEFKTKTGKTQTGWIEEFTNNKGILKIETDDEVVSAVVDPDWYLFDADRANNIYPRNNRSVFLLSYPAITSNEYFYGPSFTYGLTDGIRIGAWLTNTYPIDPLKKILSNFEWRTSLFYGIKSKKISYTFLFNSFYGMSSNKWNYGLIFEDFRGIQTTGINLSYRFSDDRILRFSFDRRNIKNISYYDPKDFEKGISTSLSANYQMSTLGLSILADLKSSQKILDGMYSFSKGTITISGRYPFLPEVSFRLFAGGIVGNYPTQEAVFLSGSILPSSMLYWFLDPDNKISTQEFIHTTGDANLRGYIKKHINGKNALGLNSEYAFPFFSPLKLFADIGNVWDKSLNKLIYDLGLSLDFTLFRLDFPLFISDPANGESKLKFRCSLEVIKWF